MKFKVKDVELAMSAIRSNANVSDTGKLPLDIEIKPEDPGAGKICDVMVMKTAVQRNPGNYDDNKNPTLVDITVEVFAEDENRSPRTTVVYTRDLA